MNKRRGFTLIELLVVIAIIALLVSILLPSLKRAKELANSVLCMSNQKAIGVMFAYYTQENDGVLPSYDPFLPGLQYWDQKILKASEADVDSQDAAIFHCPTDKLKHLYGQSPRSFSYNPVLCNLGGGYAAHGATQPANQGMPISNIPRPGEIVSILEFHHEYNRVGEGSYVCWSDPTWPHFEKTNLLFVDNHVASLEKEACDIDGVTWIIFGQDYLYIN